MTVIRYQVESSIGEGHSISVSAVALGEGPLEDRIEVIKIRVARESEFGCCDEEIYISHEDAKALARMLRLIEQEREPTIVTYGDAFASDSPRDVARKARKKVDDDKGGK